MIFLIIFDASRSRKSDASVIFCERGAVTEHLKKTAILLRSFLRFPKCQKSNGFKDKCIIMSKQVNNLLKCDIISQRKDGFYGENRNMAKNAHKKTVKGFTKDEI